MPRRQPAKIKALQQTIRLARLAINNKRWPEARYALSRARALVNLLPANLTVQERQQLSDLRRKYAARNTPAAKTARKATATKAAGRNGSMKSSMRKRSSPKNTTKQRDASPVRDLGSRFVNRAALGYASSDVVKDSPNC
jgi:hypothetical protein